MRERAAAAGGTIDIGPGPSGGFRVVAEFPLDSPSAPAADAAPTAPAAEATPANSADSTTQKAGR
jgi:two-component system sensor histidine kinase DesK